MSDKHTAITIEPRKLGGTVQIVPSKSHLHRVLICAAQGILRRDMREITVLCHRTASEDVDVTLDCIGALGVQVTRREGRIHLAPGTVQNSVPTLNCRESGSSLRFLLPFAGTVVDDYVMTGTGRLPKRPMGVFADILHAQGLSFFQEGEDFLPARVKGKLSAGIYELPGDISSQYISGLLMALPALHGRSEIRLTTKVQSAPYIEMTLDTLRKFGVVWKGSVEEGYFTIHGPIAFKASSVIEPEGDWSSAAFWVSAKSLGADIVVKGLQSDSTQGDKVICDLCTMVGNGATVNVEDVPDLVPVLSVVCALREGCTTLTGTARLRLKESDRVQSVTEMINRLGGQAIGYDDSIVIEGKGVVKGGTVDSYGDHRIAMAAAIAGCFSQEGVTVLNPYVTDKSYPGFYEDLRSLGGMIHVSNIW